MEARKVAALRARLAESEAARVAAEARIAKLEVIRRSDARRAKLYYLRDRFGKARRLRDQRGGDLIPQRHDGLLPRGLPCVAEVIP